MSEDDPGQRNGGGGEALPVILMVDDSRLMRVAIKKMLRDTCEIVEAVDGEDGWSKLADHHEIRGVFSDLLMPKLDGFGLLDRLRASSDERLRTIPFVLVTGKEGGPDALLPKVRERGGNGIVGKPFNSEDVKRVLAGMLEFRPQVRAQPEPVAQVEQPGQAARVAELEAALQQALDRANKAEEQVAAQRAEAAQASALQQEARQAASEAQAQLASRETEQQELEMALGQALREAEERAGKAEQRAQQAEQRTRQAEQALARYKADEQARLQEIERQARRAAEGEAAARAEQEAARQARADMQERARQEAAQREREEAEENERIAAELKVRLAEEQAEQEANKSFWARLMGLFRG